MEIWKPVKDYEGLYEVSNLGRVNSLFTRKGKIMKPKLEKDGYLRIGFWKEGKQKYYNVHRLVAESFCLEKEGYQNQINHINKIKSDNRLDNLEWVTRHQNIQHGFITGLIKPLRGEQAVNCTLTNEQVLYIFNYNGSPRQLSRDLGMPYSKIASIRNGVTWNHVTGAPKKYYGKEKEAEEGIKEGYTKAREGVENYQTAINEDRKSTRLNSSHLKLSRMPSSA